MKKPNSIALKWGERKSKPTISERDYILISQGLTRLKTSYLALTKVNKASVKDYDAVINEIDALRKRLVKPFNN